jgi:hemolysin-activating ACP:hemolysin acyltransferase
MKQCLSLVGNDQLLDSRKFQAIGVLATLLANSPTWRGNLCGLVRTELTPAYRHGNLRIFFDLASVPTGFITWAWLSEETERRIVGSLDDWLHISEWNEGPSLWVREFFLPPHLYAHGIDLAMRGLFPDTTYCKVMRQRRGALAICELDRGFLERLVVRSIK